MENFEKQLEDCLSKVDSSKREFYSDFIINSKNYYDSRDEKTKKKYPFKLDTLIKFLEEWEFFLPELERLAFGNAAIGLFKSIINSHPEFDLMKKMLTRIECLEMVSPAWVCDKVDCFEKDIERLEKTITKLKSRLKNLNAKKSSV